MQFTKEFGSSLILPYYPTLLSNSTFAMESRFLGQFLWKIIWKSLAPLKASVFVWEASHGSILSCDNLQKKGIIWWTDVLCPKTIWSLLITYYYIVNLQGLCGSYPLVAWESPELSRILWGIIFWLGRVPLIGKLKREASYWSHMRFSRLFGERETKSLWRRGDAPSTNQKYYYQDSFFLG